MKKNAFTPCLCWLLVSSSFLVSGQDLTLLTSAGGFASVNDLHLSYSIGEPVTDYVQNGSVWLTQGYQQPGHMTIMVSTDEATSRQIRLFPNPAQAEITIAGYDPAHCNLLRLYNTLGQPVFTLHITSDHQRIRVFELPPGLYYASMQCDAIQFRTTSFIKL